MVIFQITFESDDHDDGGIDSQLYSCFLMSHEDKRGGRTKNVIG